MLKEFWIGKIKFNWTLGLGLILLFSCTRFITVLYGIQTGDNKYLSIIFSLMIVLPFLLLNKAGRTYAKIKKSKSFISILKSFIIGAAVCYLIYLLGLWLYGDESLNWFRYIGETYPLDFETISSADKKIYFIVFVLIGMTFSPLGEELLYRGIIHASFVKDYGEKAAAIIDSLAFGLVHLAHYGIFYNSGNWSFHLVPALIWISLMFGTGLIFNYCKRMSDSIWGAVIAHMAFNIMMTYLIFYKLF